MRPATRSGNGFNSSPRSCSPHCWCHRCSMLSSQTCRGPFEGTASTPRASKWSLSAAQALGKRLLLSFSHLSKLDFCNPLKWKPGAQATSIAVWQPPSEANYSHFFHFNQFSLETVCPMKSDYFKFWSTISSCCTSPQHLKKNNHTHIKIFTGRSESSIQRSKIEN